MPGFEAENLFPRLPFDSWTVRLDIQKLHVKGSRILFCFKDPTCKISDSGLWGDVFATVGASLVLDRGVGLVDEVE